MGPDRLVRTYLVYGKLPRLGIPMEKPFAEVLARAGAVSKASEKQSLLFAKRQFRGAKRSRNMPSSAEIHKLTIGYKVAVYETNSKSW